ncbi:MAG: hypothetical protein R3181_00380 [Rubricoccaceae bacterium]|nr:hypothetical protein [Rubricoccaceae bacterium]
MLLQRLQDGGPSAIEGLALFTARTSEGLAVYVSPRAARALEETVAYLGGRPSPPPPDTPTLRLVTGDPGVWRQVVRPV